LTTSIFNQPRENSSPRRFAGIQAHGLLFTMVDPHRGREVDYNRWYEGDHFYATTVGPGVISGSRYVCTRDLKELRLIGDQSIIPSREAGSYLALYLLSDAKEFNEWGAVNTHHLHDAGRIFNERQHIHTLMYTLEWWSNGGPDGVTPEIALDHPFSFLITEFISSIDPSNADDDVHRIATHYVPAVQEETGASLTLGLSPVRLLDDAPTDVPRAEGMENTYLQLHFYDEGSPEVAMNALDKMFEPRQAEALTLRFASPFIPTVPGTDKYAGELW
jgi:hypothetical protein